MSDHLSDRPPLPQPLAEVPVLAIFRGLGADAVVATAHALAEEGVRAVEVTLDSPGALEAVRRLAAHDGLAVGAGTVLDRAGARAAVDAGASYLVSPHTSTEVLGAGRDFGVPTIPGALTPTEIESAWRAGASAVKVFPAGTLGPGYLRAVGAPLGHVPLIPTGGIDGDNAAEYLRAGAAVVGLGGWLVGAGDPAKARRRAAALVAAVAAGQAGSRGG